MKKKYTKRSISLNYFLFLYILAISSFEFFFRATSQGVYLLFPFVIIGFIYYNKKIDVLFLKIVAPFICVFILQSLLFGTPLYFSITLLIRSLSIYLAVSIIGKDFVKIFINTISVISAISLTFYIIQYVNNELLYSISEHFTNINSNLEILNDRPNFIIYTIGDGVKTDFGLYRNYGPFFEPGLLALYLNIALTLNLLKSKRIFNKKNNLFIIVIITTFSTMGLLALFINLILFGLYNKSLKLLYRILLVSLLVLSIPALISISFVGDKIQEQMNDSDVSYSRFGAAVVHYNIVKDYPITGLPYDETSYSKYADNISPNGITEIFLRYGIIAGLFYYYCLFRATVSIVKIFNSEKKALWLFLILVVVLFSETQGNSPMYWAIVFSQIPLSVFLKKWNRLQNIKESRVTQKN